jgi:hypothetical protein
MYKGHKVPMGVRPVGRGFTAVLRRAEQWLAKMLVNITEEEEKRRVDQDELRIIITNTKSFQREMEAVREYVDLSDGDGMIEILSFDVVAMFPSLQWQFVVREIDTIMKDREERAGSDEDVGHREEERVKVRKLREIVIRLLIFILQHQFVYVRTDGDRKDEEKVLLPPNIGNRDRKFSELCDCESRPSRA